MTAGNDINITNGAGSITITHQAFTSTNTPTTDQVTSGNDNFETFTAIDTVTTDNGHLTGYTTKTITINTPTLANVTSKNGTTTNNISVGNITLSGGAGTPTSAYLRGPAELVIDPAGYEDNTEDNTGTVKILGNLIVEGTTTTINSTNLSTKDKVVELGRIDDITGITGIISPPTGSNETWKATVTGVSIDTASLITGMTVTETGTNTGSFGNKAYILDILNETLVSLLDHLQNQLQEP